MPRATIRLSRKIDKLTHKALFSLIGPGMIRVMNSVAVDLRDFIKSRFMGGATTSTNRLARNTGKMEQKTIAVKALQSTTSTRAGVQINVPYASVHFGEKGKTSTTIRPRRAQALSVPLFAVRGPNKRPLFAARSPQITGKFTFGGILYGRLPGRKTDALFAMKDHVVVPVRVSVERDIQPVATQMMHDRIQLEVTKLFGD